jgi:heme-degrading monooxygenase HmoA
MSAPTFHLAEINIARLRAPLDDPSLAPFVAALESVNALADASPGFVWRLTGEGGDATDVRAFDDPDMLINMSVWESLEALAAFVYRAPEHRAIMRRRAEFFVRPEVYTTLWWVPAGHRPTTAEGAERLEQLRRLGPGTGAFTFRQPFPAPGGHDVTPVLDRCA